MIIVLTLSKNLSSPLFYKEGGMPSDLSSPFAKGGSKGILSVTQVPLESYAQFLKSVQRPWIIIENLVDHTPGEPAFVS
jgi:hypothetical protein